LAKHDGRNNFHTSITFFGSKYKFFIFWKNLRLVNLEEKKSEYINCRWKLNFYEKACRTLQANKKLNKSINKIHEHFQNSIFYDFFTFFNLFKIHDFCMKSGNFENSRNHYVFLNFRPLLVRKNQCKPWQPISILRLSSFQFRRCPFAIHIDWLCAKRFFLYVNNRRWLPVCIL
jgi:hypothetical protein